MSARSHSPTRHRGRRKGRRGSGTDNGPVQAGIGRGMPRYLSKPKASDADVSSSSEHEARDGNTTEVQQRPVETPLGQSAAHAMKSGPKEGRPLAQAEKGPTERRLGMDFSDVQVKENSELASAFGANAMTYDDAIHFAPGRSATSELLGHELTHVAQQRQFGSGAAQFDMSINAVDEDTGLGDFDLALTTASSPIGSTTAHGMFCNIDFEPDAAAPYSNRIGFVQTADLERTSLAGEPDMVWSGGEANRESIKTDEGTFVDAEHAGLPADGNTEPWYWQGFTTNDADDPTSRHRFGWNRSEADRHSVHLGDFPRATFPARYDFETVAIGRDNQTIYGAVRWGFETDGSTGTSNEWYDVQQVTQSGTDENYQTENFDNALDNFRNFYAHEPIIVYFGSGAGQAEATELGKLGDAPAYLTENPEAQIRLTASADAQGGVSEANHQLAIERMNAVHSELLLLGVSPGRIVRDETAANASRAEGSQDAAHRNSEGSYQANRRVTVSFENTVSLPP